MSGLAWPRGRQAGRRSRSASAPGSPSASWGRWTRTSSSLGWSPVKRTSPTGFYPEARGRGLASPRVALMCTFLATRHGVREAIIRTEPANAASVAVALRTGFRLARRGGEGRAQLVRPRPRRGVGSDCPVQRREW
ncbi:GNAT family N-acetyltransferase [Cellulomonas sp. KRMCY2]|uniref:GNAT family N-acetyltransferase n=1 Tax=Cellulomonas sp. KRMCY2 TaxID=1304865 RepID=UPI0018CC2DD8